MEKAYDLDVLLATLKAKGLQQAEKTLLIVLTEVSDWANESADMGTKGLIDMAVKALTPVVVPFGKELVDKIDGEKNLA